MVLPEQQQQQQVSRVNQSSGKTGVEYKKGELTYPV